jgi:hypothetical protein
LDAANITAGHGFKHPVLPLAATTAASKPADSSKSGSKYGSGDKSAKYKSVRFSGKDNKEYRDNRGRGGSILQCLKLLYPHLKKAYFSINSIIWIEPNNFYDVIFY